ncbi:FAD-binding oxidoreductase [Phormidesmis priestleyi]
MEAVAPVLKNLVGEAGVCPWDSLDATTRSSLSQAAPNSAIAYVVYPNTQAELASVMTCAAKNGWRVLPCGSGSKLGWGELVQGVNLVISTQRLNRLIDHAIGDLTVTAEAGFCFSELQNLLAKAGQFLAIDPSYPDRATLGGIIATADTGSLRHRYNSVRDMLLGVSFVRSDGQIVKAGGRVVKNVAGYDLMKLLTGSYGTLGILTQVTFRVYPIPEASQTVVLAGDRHKIAQATQTLISSALEPAAIDLLSSQSMKTLELGRGVGLVIRFQSIGASVKQQADRTIELATALGLSTTIHSQSDEAILWRRLADQMPTADQSDAIACKIGVRPSEAVAILSQIEERLPSAIALIHVGSGVGFLVLEATVTRSTQILEVRSICEAAGGYLSLLQAPIPFKQQMEVWGYSGSAIDLMKKIKQQFDPAAILSPHRFVGNI